jgi:hypothetical protein
MLRAQLHGKLGPAQENLEDILTSNVFGAFSYLPPDEGLARFLARVEGGGSGALRALLGSSVVEVSYEFWPWIERAGCRGCEPDVLIRIATADGARALICVEAKYLSGKSSVAIESATATPPNDQLARQWDNAAHVAADEGRHAFVVYVTAHYARPDDEIEASQTELVALRGERGRILWLPWRALSQLDFGAGLLAADLVRVMRERYALTYFTGIAVASARLGWAFAVRSHRLSWIFRRSNNWRWSR